MDLDEFERSVPLDVPSATAPNNLSTRDAIRVLDDVWWSQRSRAARWMDLIGDYAGMERFVIDGERARAGAVSWVDNICAGDALIQSILDDPLLGLAKENGNDCLLALPSCRTDSGIEICRSSSRMLFIRSRRSCTIFSGAERSLTSCFGNVRLCLKSSHDLTDGLASQRPFDEGCRKGRARCGVRCAGTHAPGTSSAAKCSSTRCGTRVSRP